MPISIFQGTDPPPKQATISIVIDVLRAFTVAHYAFLNGVKEIYLVPSKQKAFQLREDNPDYLLVGETNGISIHGFDKDNSPSLIKQENLIGKTLVQKTTNGVQATLNCLSMSNQVYVTGFTNARKTSQFVREKMKEWETNDIHIIASHPTGDEDYACAQYMKNILEGIPHTLSRKGVIERIILSEAGQRLLHNGKPYLREDVLLATRVLDSNFVMKVDKMGEIPRIVRV